jgi:Skp family chaperone for outer membrane proteins
LFKSKSVVTMLAATAMLLAAPYAAAESKLGYINLQRVSNEAPQAQRAMKKIKAEFEKRPGSPEAWQATASHAGEAGEGRHDDV